MNTPTPTPRTDAAWSSSFESCEYRAAHTARTMRECSQQLETELAALTAERDQLRLDCDNETKWAAHYLAQSIADKARAERAEADLAKERARLDWIESDAGVGWQWSDIAGGIVSRAAIDAAMKEGAK